MSTATTRPRSTGSRRPAAGAPTRRPRVVIAVAAGILLVVIAAVVVLGSAGASTTALDPASAQQGGAKALVTVLRQQGITVKTTTTLAATKRIAAEDPDGTTVLAYDSGPYLSTSQWRGLVAASAHTVAIDPGQEAVDAITSGLTLGSGALSGTVAPSCDLPALAESSRVTSDGTRYTVSRGAASSSTSCLPASTGRGYGLVQQERDGHAVTVLGSAAALTNQYVGTLDNGAFALALLGDSPTLVWYLPSLDDLPAGSGTLASLTPGWVTPSIVLLAAAGVAAAVWRGRRLGPLVIENLPVVVRATETVEGRARLYERSSARLHALDQVRIGTIGRLGASLGLPRSAGVDDVVFGAAAALGVDPREIRVALVDAVPADDRHLVALSDSLRDLEAAVARAVRPG